MLSSLLRFKRLKYYFLILFCFFGAVTLFIDSFFIKSVSHYWLKQPSCKGIPNRWFYESNLISTIQVLNDQDWEYVEKINQCNDETCSVTIDLPLIQGFNTQKYPSIEVLLTVPIRRSDTTPRRSQDGVYYDKFSDHVWAQLLCIGDESDPLRSDPLCSIRTLNAGSSEFQKYHASGIIPKGTTKLRVIIYRRNLSGKNHDNVLNRNSDFSIKLYKSSEKKVSNVIKTPQLWGGRTAKVCVSWETDQPFQQNVLEWWKRGEHSILAHQQLAETTQVDFCHFVHKACAANLLPNAEYNYRIYYGIKTTPMYSFTSSPSIGLIQREKGMTIGLISDNQNEPDTFTKLLSVLSSHKPNMILHVGDVVQDGDSLTDWHNYFYSPLSVSGVGSSIPLALTRGNHDGEFPVSYAYTFLPENEAYYSFAFGNCFFLVLNSNANSLMAPNQIDFMKAKIKSLPAQKALFKVVLFHVPPFTNLWGPSLSFNGEPFIRDEWVIVLETLDIDLLVSGHTHSYENFGTKMTKFVSVNIGGGGGGLDIELSKNLQSPWPFVKTKSTHHFVTMTVQSCKLEWNAFDIDNNIFDTFTLSKCTS